MKTIITTLLVFMTGIFFMSNSFGQNYVISGTIKTPAGTGVSGVTITFSNSGGTATTASNGTYSKTVPSGWSGTATPSNTAGWTFSPSSKNYTNVTSNQTYQDYTGGWAISGTITKTNGDAAGSVSIVFSNSGGSTTTNSNGIYSIIITPGWSGTATPTMASPWVFDPINKSFTSLSANQADQNFTATSWPVIVSGYVYISYGGNTTPYAGAPVNIAPNNTVLYTDAFGKFSITETRGWSGTITPVDYSCPNYTFPFTPTSRVYSNVLAAKTENQNFTLTPSQMYTISGTFTDSVTGAPISNKTIVFRFKNGNEVPKIEVTTNTQGQYSLKFLPCWSGTFDPEYGSDLYITPLKRTFTNITSNYSNQNFKVYNFNYGTPPGWEIPATAPAVHTVSVFTTSNPNVCGTALKLGDLIGGFYVDDNGSLKCGGYGLWTPEKNTPVVLKADDGGTTGTPWKDGFISNEVINWRFYSWENNITYPAYPTYYTSLGGQTLDSDGKFSANALSAISTMPGYVYHQVEIPAGWGSISSYQVTRVSNINVSALFSPIVNDLVILQNLTQTYWPSQGTNTIGAWSRTKGYKIKMANTKTLPIEGCPGTNNAVSLASGWNLFPVLVNCNTLLTDVFTSTVISKVTIIKDVAGPGVFWPEMNINTLQILQPGKAYLAKMNSSATITYPACSGNEKSGLGNTQALHNLTPWNDPVVNVSSHVIAIPAGCLEQIEKGDYIGAFTQNGTCAGLTSINNLNEPAAITLYGDDNMTYETEGLYDGETLTFKLYRTSNQKQYDVWVEYDVALPSYDGTFVTDGLSAFKTLQLTSTGTGEMSNKSVHFYPNPTTGTIRFGMSNQAASYQLTIMDLLGNTVFEETVSDQMEINLSALNEGIYLVKIESSDYVKIEKLVIK